MLSRTWVVPLCIALCVVAALFAIVGFIYLFVPAGHLPGFFPGRPHAPRLTRYKVHHTTHPYRRGAIVAFAIVAVPLIGAWWLRFRYEPPD